jgi:hypothetical protein
VLLLPSIRFSSHNTPNTDLLPVVYVQHSLTPFDTVTRIPPMTQMKFSKGGHIVAADKGRAKICRDREGCWRSDIWDWGNARASPSTRTRHIYVQRESPNRACGDWGRYLSMEVLEVSDVMCTAIGFPIWYIDVAFEIPGLSTSVTYRPCPPLHSPSVNPQTHVHLSPSKQNRLGRSRVGFDDHCITPQVCTRWAIRITEKYERNPSQTGNDNYRKTIDLRSSSGWIK